MHYYGNLSLYYSDTYTEKRAWCIREEKWVGIERNSSKPDSYQQKGKAAVHAKDRQHTEQNIRQVPIIEQNVREGFQLTKVEESIIPITSSTNLENMSSVATEDTQQSQEKSAQRVQPVSEDIIQTSKPDVKLHIPQPVKPQEQNEDFVSLPQQVSDIFGNCFEPEQSLKITKLARIGFELDKWLRLDANKWNEKLENVVEAFLKVIRYQVDNTSIKQNETIDLDEVLYNLSMTLCRNAKIVDQIFQLRNHVFENYEMVIIKNAHDSFEERIEDLDKDCFMVQNPVVWQSILEVLISNLSKVVLLHPIEKSQQSNHGDSVVKKELSQKTKKMMARTRIKVSALLKFGRGKAFQTIIVERTKKVEQEKDLAMKDFERLFFEREIETGDTEKSYLESVKGKAESLKDSASSWISNKVKNPFGKKSEEEKAEKIDRATEIPNMEEKLFDFTLEDILHGIPNEGIRDILSKFQYFDDEKVSQTIKIVATKLRDSNDFDNLEVSWLMLKFMSDLQEDFENCAAEFLILLASNSVNDWLQAFIAFKLWEHIGLKMSERKKFMTMAKTLAQREILLQLSQKLDEELNLETDLKLDDIIEILSLSQHFKFDIQISEQLANLSLSAWPLRMQWWSCLVTVSSEWQVQPALKESEIHSMGYFLMEVEHKYGADQAKRLKTTIANQDNPVSKEVLEKVMQG